jgi:hypothetical protein
VSTALQCPSCGYTHRLDAIGDVAVFQCSNCSRVLKVPEQLRSAASRAAPAVPAPAKPKRQVAATGSGPRRSVRMLAWVIAFILGGLVLVRLAKWTGFFGGDKLVDLLLDNSISNYLRLAALVPLWGLFTAAFATLFLEGPRWYRRWRAGVSGAAPAEPPAPKPSRGDRVREKAAGATARKVPTRAPAPSERVPPAASGAAERATAGEEFATKAASGQRPRRIPRRAPGA